MLIEHLGQEPCRQGARQARQIDRGLGVSGPLEDAAFTCPVRQDMAAESNIVASRRRVRSDADGSDPLLDAHSVGHIGRADWDSRRVIVRVVVSL